MNYLFILNPKSGPVKRTNKIVQLIDKLFSEAKHSYEFAFTTGPHDATRIARQGVQEKFDIIVAAGGDGTVNEVATGLINSPAAMGIIPLGSGNGVARSLNIPVQVRKSIGLLLEPHMAKIDIGRINDDYFVGVSGLGFDARIGAHFQEFGIRGPLPYFIIGVKEFLKYKPEKVRLKINGQTLETAPLLIALANTRQYGNGALIAPAAKPNDGLLDICIIDAVHPIIAVGLILKLFRGKIARSDKYHHYRAKTVRIEGGAGKIIVHTDGEPRRICGDLVISLLEKALNVCVGEDFRFSSAN